MCRNGLIFMCVAIAICSSVTAERTSYFLPRTSIPEFYDVSLNLLKGNKYYTGEVNIFTDVKERTDQFVLHTDNVEINPNKTYLLTKTEAVKLRSYNVNPENHFLTLIFEQAAEANQKYVLSIQFKSRFYTSQQGLFLSKYKGPSGEERFMVASHLEPIGARSIFPCYDEPDLKAKFQVAVYHPRGTEAVSNAPVASIRDGPTFRRTNFKFTQKMSTYLLALTVSDFKTIKWDYRGKALRLYAKPEEVNNTEFSLDITKKTLHYLEQVLQVDYSPPKLDSIAVPAFGGGMENWGLIIYGNQVIVKDPKQKPTGTVNLICHEVAHQWFGDLVTNKWWDFLWLNEGFATYYASRIADMIMPEGRFMDNHYARKIVTLKQAEGVSSAKDFLDRHVEKPNELRSKFNSVSYDKGSVIVRLMYSSFPNFDQGITNYLNKYSLKNAVSDDLFDELNSVTSLPSGGNVKTIMRTWARNAGYPLVTVSVSSQNGYRNVEIQQERYSVQAEKLPETWWIPITLTTQENPDFKSTRPTAWLSNNGEKINLKADGSNGWIIANVQQAVHCRVNYDLGNWKKIAEFLKGPSFEQIHHLNRMQLIDDSNNLAKSGHLPEKVSLDLLAYLKQEKDEVVLKVAKKSFVRYAELLKDTSIYPKYKLFVKDVLGQDEADNLMEPISLNELVEEVLNELSKLKRDESPLYELSEHIYSEKELNELEEAFEQQSRLKFGANSDYKDTINNIKELAAANIDGKKKFFARSFPEVKDWLQSQY